MLGCAKILDKRQIHVSQLKKRHFDLLQYYITKYTKEGFHDEYNFGKLYLHIIKVLYVII